MPRPGKRGEGSRGRRVRGGEEKTGLRSGGARVVRAGLGLGRVEKLPDHGGPFGDAGGDIAKGTRQPGLSVGDGLGLAGEALLRVGKVGEGHQVAVRCGGSIVVGRARGVPSRAASDGRVRCNAGEWPERRVQALNSADLAERRDIEMLLRQPGDLESGCGGGREGGRGVAVERECVRGLARDEGHKLEAERRESRPAVRMWSQSLAAWKSR